MSRKNRRSVAPKQPAQAFPVEREKRPRLAVSRDDHDQRPVWRFGHMDHDGPFAWDWAAFHHHLGTLVELERRRWDDFTGSGSIGAKRIALSDGSLSREALRRLERIKFDDADALWEIRVGGKPRFWGVRLGSCFHFLWWDPDHLVCPTKRVWGN